jgi:hypothetical protein
MIACNLREALTRIEQLANLPEITGCPLLRIASEYPETPSVPSRGNRTPRQNS